MKTFKVKDVVAAAILAALVFVLLRYVAIPTPLPDTTLSIHNAIIAFFAILYGPVVAFVGGFVGNLLVDITAGWGIWWSWIVPTGLFGLIIGLFCKFDLENGQFGKKEIIRLNVVQVLAAFVCWGLVAPLGDILFYSEPAGKVFSQGLCIGISAVVCTAVVTTLLAKAYASSKAKKGSLSKEQ